MPLIVFILAIAFFSIHLVMTKLRISTQHKMELLMAYLFFFLVGLQSLFSFIAHIFYPNQTAQIIGWAEGNPFQFEAGIANLVFAVLGILAIWFRKGFWIAIIIGYTVWLWGCVIGHIKQIIVASNFSEGNAGIYFYSDLITPLVLILSFLFYLKSISSSSTWKGKWKYLMDHKN